MIALYRGEGVSADSLRYLIQRLRSYPLRLVKPNFFSLPDWEAKTSLVVFPGGRDVPYQAALAGEKNRRLAAYVRGGGKYLGICAGAYYGSAMIAFEQGGPLEVCGARELAFFPGRARGPALGQGVFAYESDTGACQTEVSWREERHAVYYNGGCLFEAPERFSKIDILARYSQLPEHPAAIIQCAVGRGTALLSGVHPEYPSSDTLWGQIASLLIKN